MVSSDIARISNVLNMAKETFWLEHKHLNEEQRECRWSEHVAELRSALDPSAPQRTFDLNSVPEHLSMEHSTRNLGRNMESENWNSTSQPLDIPTRQRPGCAGAANALSRKRSSDSRFGPSPGPASFEQVRSLSAMDAGTADNPIIKWQKDEEEPYHPHKRRASASRLGTIDCTVVQDPSKFTMSSVSPRPLNTCAQPMANCNSRARAQPATQTRPSMTLPRQIPNASRKYSSFTGYTSVSRSPLTPFSESMQTMTTPTSAAMSRQCSSLAGGIGMMRVQSQASNINADSNLGIRETTQPLSQSYPINHPSPFSLGHSDLSQIVDHADTLLSDPSPMYDTTPPLQPIKPMAEAPESLSQFAVDSGATSMIAHSRPRSNSMVEEVVQKPSHSSSISTGSLESSQMSRTSSSFGTHQVVRTKSADGQVKELVSIPKTNYTRPLHHKVRCKKCERTFKGDHELTRHIKNKHAINRKGWVCKDISPRQDFLSSCKACAQKKRYNVYYNAAAHLRRVHFLRKKIDGADWPKMEILKHWMEEVESFAPENVPELDDSSAEGEVIDASQREHSKAEPSTQGISSEDPLTSIGNDHADSHWQSIPYSHFPQLSSATSEIDEGLLQRLAAEQQQAGANTMPSDNAGDVSDFSFRDDSHNLEFSFFDANPFDDLDPIFGSQP